MSRRPWPSVWIIAGLLAGSGFCALVYQVVWLRELRLVFGASTPASAAVLAIYMGGLGAGGLVLGRRVDRSAAPLRFYARLEFGIALLAAVTPLLVAAATRAYVASGGAPALGGGAATLLRLGLATLVLAGPTFLMGGTLPAAARAAVRADDPDRRAVAALYGLNTLGGLAGVLLPTFVLFERIGVHATLWTACLVNLEVATLAWRLGRPADGTAAEAGTADAGRPAASAAEAPAAAPAALVLTAAGLSGAAFLAMELVWYRLLTPLLGGSTYTFGLILAFVLLGIGAGGLACALTGRRREPDLLAFALTCALAAVLLAVPLALGDRLAGWALTLQPPVGAGFAARVRLWSLLCAIVVLPGTLVAGWQFPLLIGLLGRGRRAIGRQVGQAYACNTVGAIAGSLAGGFGLMRALTAPGLWRAVVVALLLLGAAAALLARRKPAGPRGQRWRLAAVAALVVAGAAMLTAAGPTAAWRHAPIGTGHLRLADTSPNGLHAYRNEIRRNTRWEVEGIESSVALQSTLGLSYIINGKSDGSARFDAPTQVMCGLVAAAVHPAPRTALVVGLGSGSTAGWLAAVPRMERVDVAELEPAIVEVARACDAVNAQALANPKLHLFLGDGREMLLAAKDRYDIIASEPSNPFRAGVASLFTRECYRAVRAHLNPGGIFVQWVQAYEIDEQTLRTIVATLAGQFAHVQTWQTATGDLMFLCSDTPVPLDAGALRFRLRTEPFRTGLRAAWQVDDLEGFLARFVADDAFARDLARAEAGRVNTDDRPLVEFGFARSLGRAGGPLIGRLRERAVAARVQRPAGLTGAVDWDEVEAQRIALCTLEQTEAPAAVWWSADLRRRAAAATRFLAGDAAGTVAAWLQGGDAAFADAHGPVEMAMLAWALADLGDARAEPLLARLRGGDPLGTQTLTARLAWRQGRADAAVSLLADALIQHRVDPWPWPVLMSRALDLAREMAATGPQAAGLLLSSLGEPFAVRQLDHERLSAALEAAKPLGDGAVVGVFRQIEPYFIWNEGMLTARAALYRAQGLPEAARAERELAAFRRAAR